MIHRTKSDHCPVCQTKIDRAGEHGTDPRPPEPEDLTVCLYCGGVLKFGPDLKLAKATPEDVKDLPTEELKKLVAYQKWFALHRTQKNQ